MLKGRNLIKPNDLTVSEIDEICGLFFEPSTRTRLSFEAAMLHLGGAVEGFSDAANSSTAKGESLSDTIRTVSSYVDVIAMRNPKEGAALVASQYSNCPIINAGDGGHYHPTQTLTDMLTIRALQGGFEGHTIGFCGDLKFGRTVHSLAEAMARYKNNKYIFISPNELQVPEYVTQELDEAGIQYTTAERLENVIGDLDILYMTRVQKERFFNEQDYIRLKDSYILDNQKMSLARKNMIVLHPLPRVNEIAPEVDSDPRAAYFKQVKYGMYVRMALIAKLVGAL